MTKIRLPKTELSIIIQLLGVIDNLGPLIKDGLLFMKNVIK